MKLSAAFGRTPAILFVASLLSLLLVAWILRPPPVRPLPQQGAELRGVVLVVPGWGRSDIVDISIRGDRIASIQNSTSSRVEGYVLPGFANAHMHEPSLVLPGHRRLFAFLHLYHGVTGARLASGEADMRDAIRASRYPGPRLQSCGPFVDGDPPLWPGSKVITDPAAADALVELHQQQGFDCLKVYNELTPQVAVALHVAANRRGMPVIGHVPWQQDLLEASIDDIQHLVGWSWPYAGEGEDAPVRRLLNLEGLNSERLDAIAAAALRRGFTFTPTLVTLERKFSLSGTPLPVVSGIEWMPAIYSQQLWHAERGLVAVRILDSAEQARFESILPLALAAVRSLYEQDFEIHVGTDSPAEAIVPGAGLHEEMRLLERAGLSPEQVLEIASVTTPRYLFGDEYGRLDPGSPADLVIFSGDPTADLAQLDTIEAIVRGGYYYDRNWLDAEMRTLQAWHQDSAYRFVTTSLVGAALWVLNLL